jgi:hypothetical protein
MVLRLTPLLVGLVMRGSVTGAKLTNLVSTFAPQFWNQLLGTRGFLSLTEFYRGQ